MSNSHGITVENLMSEFPMALRDEGHVEALGETIAAFLVRQFPLAQRSNLYARIQELTEAELDILAQELNTPFYNTSLPAETKRTLIRETPFYYLKYGTVGAVNRILRAVFPAGVLEEWFNYDGEPYCFRIKAENHGNLQGIDYAAIVSIIRTVQRIAAHLDSVMITADNGAAPLFVSAAVPVLIFNAE